ncbi:MAG: DUF547 domain-containing protein [Chitinivorax sp.]
MKKLIFACSLLLSSLAQAAGFDHSAWDGLLKKNVVSLRQGQATQVNYAAMAAERAKLKAYLAATAAVPKASFDSWSKPEQLAFLINVYNAATVDLVLNAWPKVDSIKDLGSILQSPWKKRFIPLLGETRSLDDIEHGLIRAEGRYQEPRIHFATNCASIGCPALRPEAYSGEKLAAQLEEATRLFLSDRSRNRLEGDNLKVSSIFKWYRQDFEKGWGGFNSLPQFFGSYSKALGISDSDVQKLKSGAIDIDFLSYDWNLNKAP